MGMEVSLYITFWVWNSLKRGAGEKSVFEDEQFGLGLDTRSA